AVTIVADQLNGNGRQWIEAALRERLRRGLTNREKVIEAAEAGDELSHAALMAEFHSMLDEHQLPPASLCTYARQTEKHPSRGRGRVWYDAWRRDWVMMFLLAGAALEFNLAPTRNRASTDKPSAASVVAAAMKRCGHIRGTSESRLANLWGKMGDTVIAVIALQRAWPEMLPRI